MPLRRRNERQLPLGLKPKAPAEAIPRLVKAERERQLAELVAVVKRTKTHAVARVGRMQIYAYRRADGRISWTVNYRGDYQRGVAD